MFRPCFLSAVHAMEPTGDDPLGGLDALIDAALAEGDLVYGGTDTGRVGSCGDNASTAEGCGGDSCGTATGDVISSDGDVEDVPITRDHSRALPFSATVNPRRTCFFFARPTTPSDQIVVGFRGILLGRQAAVSPAQRALAGAVGNHMRRVQRAAELPFLPSSF